MEAQTAGSRQSWCRPIDWWAMGFRFEHGEPVGEGLRRVAKERLGDALERLDSLSDLEPSAAQDAVHAVRKRTKEVRGLLRMARPGLGDDYRPANAGLRDAAQALAGLRDAQALSATFADLRRAAGDGGGGLAAVQAVLDERADAATMAAVDAGDPRLIEARGHIAAVRKQAKGWDLPKGFDAVAEGLESTFRRGRRGLRAAQEEMTDENLHEWRKAVKHLWYQVRLLEPTAPSVLGPLVDRLDDLCDALGDDHDLVVLVELLESGPEAFGTDGEARAGVGLARRQQADLRRRAFGLGARVYAEKPAAFAERLELYWKVDRDLGQEPRAGTIADLAALGDEPPRTVERERKFLVAELPPVLGEGDRIRQGYFAIDGPVAVRVRERSGSVSTMTVKAGSGATRTELEWELVPEVFDALWPLTEGRCLDKTRHEVRVEGGVAEVDVFGGVLEGLCLVEVEFGTEDEMAAFVPPDWFGAEVTDDDRFTNAHLATHGLEPE